MLSRIPEKYFETAGTLCGIVACTSIAAQVVKEFTTRAPSSVSMAYVVGFLLIFLFWTFYGLRFRRPALWGGNGVAVLMQTLLLIAINLK